LMDHCMVIAPRHLADDVYLLGGMTVDPRTRETTPSRQMISYHFHESKWRGEKDMPGPRFGHACVAYETKDDDQFILVAGGVGVGNEFALNTDVYDMGKGQWFPGPKLKRGEILFYYLKIVKPTTLLQVSSVQTSCG
jgi:hypothetical protein